MIGNFIYYEDAETYIKNNKLQDYVLKYYIDTLSRLPVGEEHCIMQYVNLVKAKNIKFMIRKEKDAWFDVYYTNLVENKFRVSGLSDILSINILYKSYVEEIKRIEYSSYEKLNDHLGKIKKVSSELVEENVYSQSAYDKIDNLFSTMEDIAHALNLYSNHEIAIPIRNQKIFLSSSGESGTEQISIRYVDGSRRERKIIFSIDENDNITTKNS